ncbi:hypothetical protein DDB_G0273547 [Dictyostelium discoideum AX4]|uniref:S-adenosylmethionine-dependent methyltransferase domain-containing protein n=1 Tax=Dictyostelium discoideum TaxID=44689 RepID=Q557I0_DICDI|nr:hypothetical protein DDB_G0273417 [Dictyostelium discoideum AX4]XP_644655.1 hypothetical protein DDB_G0273547 [Dictyostelium discoideum AX4]EAL70663.1 hypothetical protein DDB_G0273417 [Dictyostelium discoideum AX4]EAL70728.1 hypothetical protein DDB_G0273547 [Dictyostelium discoideum AX4]|eukprot:XP_644596.1 hypothetical protein DDB_G0273417 [Dictyostelium discoideum AX4]
MAGSMKNLLGSLQTSLNSKPYSLGKSFIKVFRKSNGFCDFDFTLKDGSAKGIALIDTNFEPPIRIMNYCNEIFSRDYIKNSLKKAMELREKLSNDKIIDIGPKSAYRLVNDGSDGLSGLTVDVFADYLQITTLSDHWHPHVRYISEYLLNETGKKGIYWKISTKDQQMSKLYLGKGYELDEANQTTLIIEENGMKSYIDLLDLKSTGFYLEHRDNRQIISNLFKGRNGGSILNLFAHTCSFSIAPCVNGHKIQTYNIDESIKNFKFADRNFKLNGLDTNYHKFSQKDVFTQLDYLKSKSTRFDVIVLDPPPRTKGNGFGIFTSKDCYRDLLQLAIPLLNPGGFIASFVNTQSISESKWLRQIGVKNDLEINENHSKKQITIPTDDNNNNDDLNEISQLNIKEAQFSNFTKNVSPFIKLPKFKAVQYFDQSQDFNVRKGDENIAQQLKGVLLKNKVDYSKTKYYSSKQD